MTCFIARASLCNTPRLADLLSMDNDLILRNASMLMTTNVDLLGARIHSKGALVIAAERHSQ